MMIRPMGPNDLIGVRFLTSTCSEELLLIFKSNPGLVAVQRDGKVAGFLFWQKNGMLVLSGATEPTITKLMVAHWIKMVPYAKVTLDQNVAWMKMLAKMSFHATFCKESDEVTFTYCEPVAV